jgi:acyl carrier protein phosphodiesterase
VNLLAHAYLSGGINDILLGNFIGDAVKGNSCNNYPEKIKQGIILHRKIDTFAGMHTAHKQSRDRFRKEFGLYSGVVVDIVYDYFLAVNWSSYHSESLELYAKKVYRYIIINYTVLPLKIKVMVPFMIKNNWLVMYKSITGIEKVLNGMSKRTTLPAKSKNAIDILIKEKKEFFNEFEQLFTDLIYHCEKKVYI